MTVPDPHLLWLVKKGTKTAVVISEAATGAIYLDTQLAKWQKTYKGNTEILGLIKQVTAAQQSMTPIGQRLVLEWQAEHEKVDVGKPSGTNLAQLPPPPELQTLADKLNELLLTIRRASAIDDSNGTA